MFGTWIPVAMMICGSHGQIDTCSLPLPREEREQGRREGREEQECPAREEERLHYDKVFSEDMCRHSHSIRPARHWRWTCNGTREPGQRRDCISISHLSAVNLLRPTARKPDSHRKPAHVATGGRALQVCDCGTERNVVAELLRGIPKVLDHDVCRRPSGLRPVGYLHPRQVASACSPLGWLDGRGSVRERTGEAEKFRSEFQSCRMLNSGSDLATKCGL